MIPALIAAPVVRRALPWAALALVVAAGAVWAALAVRIARGEAEAATAREHAATAAREQLARDLEATRMAADNAARLAAAEAQRVRELQPQIDRLLQEVRRARPPVPAQCEPVLDPLRDALRGLRELEAGAGGAGHPAAPVRSAGLR